ncbi:MAG: hypothetical protein ACLQNE_39610 [Thermoguttaceae bacterium]
MMSSPAASVEMAVGTATVETPVPDRRVGPGVHFVTRRPIGPCRRAGQICDASIVGIVTDQAIAL